MLGMLFCVVAVAVAVAAAAAAVLLLCCRCAAAVPPNMMHGCQHNRTYSNQSSGTLIGYSDEAPAYIRSDS